jgi:hypothetical protein
MFDLYDSLNGYSAYLQQNYTISALTLKQRVITVKNFQLFDGCQGIIKTITNFCI